MFLKTEIILQPPYYYPAVSSAELLSDYDAVRHQLTISFLSFPLCSGLVVREQGGS